MKSTSSRRLLGLVALPVALATALAAVVTAPQSVAGGAAVPDPDRHSQAVTAWGWHTNATPAQMTAFLETGFRITDLEVNSASPTFSAAYVSNTGKYARGWWWYYNQTSAQVDSLVTANSARLIDIEPYLTPDGVRYAVVMVHNVGEAAKAWGYYTSASLATITDWASDNNMRVIDVDRVPGSSTFSAVMISNTGVDAKSWWHLYNVSLSTMADFADDHGARPINVERRSNGNFDVVFQKNSGQYWWWLFSVTSKQLSDAANQFGARIYQVKSRVVDGVRRYDALLINNVNSETTRIRQLVINKMTGKWGFYLKKVGGPEQLTLGEEIVFEPASMIKIVHAVTAMRDIQLTATTKDTLRTWYAHPNFSARYPGDPGYRTASTSDTDHADVCAYNNNGVLLTGSTYSDKLGPVLIKQTLQQSDNRTTDGLTRFYGFTALNDTIDLAGMAKSAVNHRIGCPGPASPQPLTHNNLTLRDAGRIYEQVEDTTILDATHRDMLYGWMSGGILGAGSLKNMITAEAIAAGLTSNQRSQFLSNVRTRSKGGSYGYCPNFDGSGTCNPPSVHSRTVGGVIWLPFKGRTGEITPTAYVYGRYWDAKVNCSFNSVANGNCTAFNKNGDGIGIVAVEMFRAEVKKALASWDQA